ncbi:hypothetical protein Glove_87g5 [Diversispora epigaea]|uniref:Protein kinase domain-containing protein n=1 Tax=Diversispora epigaea TaxID=1348612 RepID=A0A397J734_9GLOM|nr:hypothetical protein Glove_87g5 [Diversispora epigaea]
MSISDESDESNSSIEYFYRNEISYVKKNQNQLKHQCVNCGNLNQLNNTCSDCKLVEMPKWTNENTDQCEIWRWIDYSKLKNIEYLAEGGFGIALKKLKNSQEISSEFLKELTANFGGLKVIHSKGFVYRDLHPGNLMITEAYSNSKYKFIILGDLGLCRLTNETSSSEAYGKGPFANRAYNEELSVDIFNGLRPKINKGIPQCYVELIEKCWLKDPAERPGAEMIYTQSEIWINELLYDEYEDLSSVETTHSEVYITSKPLSSVDFNIDNLVARLRLFE